MGAKMENTTLTRELLEKYKSDYFIETGAHHGFAIQLALDAGISDIRSVEIDYDLYEECSAKFRDDTRVTIWWGDSLDSMPEMLDDIADRITFWLDAHGGNSPTVGPIEVPLLRELELIRHHHRKDNIIMIDDVRLMGEGPWIDVTKIRVIDKILEINPSYLIVYEDSANYKGDVMIAYVPEVNND
jgi:hypothetical protein